MIVVDEAKAIRTARIRRIRGAVLKFAYDNHDDQKGPLDDVMMCNVLMGIAITIGLNEVITVLQDLKDREYVRFETTRDFFTARVRIRKIELTHKGRDLVDGVTHDPAVQVV